MRIIKVITITLILLSMTAAQTEMTGEEIIKLAHDAQTMSGTEYIGTLAIYDKKGNHRTRKIAAASRDYPDVNVSKRIIRFLEPADVKGTGMLIFDHDDKDDDMWIFMPSLRKTRRIVSSDKGGSFMGSEFSNADLAAETMTDFNYKLIGEEDYSGELCWVVEVKPLDEDIAEDYGFYRKQVWIGQADHINRRVLFHDYDDELVKEQINSDIRLIDAENKKFQACEMQMVNFQNGRKSTMTMSDVVFNPNVKDEYFTIRYLEKP